MLTDLNVHTALACSGALTLRCACVGIHFLLFISYAQSERISVCVCLCFVELQVEREESPLHREREGPPLYNSMHWETGGENTVHIA